MAEAHNAAGNDAFNAGDFSKATELYFAAVKADGSIAKYRTNLCNALLKCGRAAMAVEEAAAAIAVDGTWPKGYYYKAVALEELGEVAKAMAACEEGLHIHRCSSSVCSGSSNGFCSSTQKHQEWQHAQFAPSLGKGGKS